MSKEQDIWLERRSGNITLRPNDHRDAFQRDRARILHSAAFRRLQSKTQILGAGQHDFYRTRLTHSLEVAQIGTGLTAQLRQSDQVSNSTVLQALIPSDALIESLCLAHDIGHPPFGHGGEIALNYKMFDSGGFEANGQTFRILTRLEPYTKDMGMDLTRRTLLGLIKYPGFIRIKSDVKAPEQQTNQLKSAEWKPIKGQFLDDRAHYLWLMEGLSLPDQKRFNKRESQESKRLASECQSVSDRSIYKSFDASIMEIADDIAYGVHDLEDAIVLNRVSRIAWEEMVLPVLTSIDNPWSNKHAHQLTDMLFSQEHYERKNAIGALVNHLITSIEIRLVDNDFEQTILKYNVCLNDSAEPILTVLKRFVYQYVILASDIQQVEFRGQQMLLKLFDAFHNDPERLLPDHIKSVWRDAEERGKGGKRIICDYLASMSDQQAQRSFNDLFGSQVI